MLVDFIIAFAFLALIFLLLINRNSKKAIVLFVASFLASELVFVFHKFIYGLVMYSVFLAILIIVLLFRDYREKARNILIALMTLPIARLIGSVMPLQQFSFLTRVAIVYSIMFISAYIIFYGLGMTHQEIGHKKIKKPVIVAIMIALGALLGLIESLIIKPEPIFQTFTLFSVFLGLSLLLSGYVEEFIFRGLLQNLFKKLFQNINITLLFTNIIFIIMHIVWKNFLELGFVFCAGWLLGWLYFKTKNLFLISMLHGFINFFLFIVWPVLYR